MFSSVFSVAEADGFVGDPESVGSEFIGRVRTTLMVIERVQERKRRRRFARSTAVRRHLPLVGLR